MLKAKEKTKQESKMKYNDYFGPMEEDCVYHLYNQGNNGIVIFKDDEDRQRFKDKMFFMMSPFVDIIAYVLMNNHFHITFRVKSWLAMRESLSLFRGLEKFVSEYDTEPRTRFLGWNISSAVISEMVRRLTMGYAKYYNNKYKRSGSLFRKGFRRKEVKEKKYMQNLIGYIHLNPQHHGYNVDYKSYKWSSYSANYELNPPFGINISELREIYGNVSSYNYFHEHVCILENVMEQ